MSAVAIKILCTLYTICKNRIHDCRPYKYICIDLANPTHNTPPPGDIIVTCTKSFGNITSYVYVYIYVCVSVAIVDMHMDMGPGDGNWRWWAAAAPKQSLNMPIIELHD